MYRVRHAWSRLIRVDHPDPDVRRRGETGIVAMVVVATATLAAVVIFAFMPNPVISIASVALPLPFIPLVVHWCRRGHVDRATVLVGVVMWCGVVLQPVLTGDTSLNLTYGAVVAAFLMFMVRPRHQPWVFVGVLAAGAVTWLTTSDATTVPVGRVDLVINGVMVTFAAAGVTLIGARRLDRVHKSERAALDLAAHDQLTGLHNRRHADEVLPQLLSDSARLERPISVAIADLDRFKDVNDAWSYAAGDQVLRRFAEILTTASRADDVVARYGGEEFLLVMPDTDLAGAAALCDRIRRQMERTTWSDIAPGLAVTVSFGVASTRDDTGHGVEALLSAADARLHTAKRQGRNTVVAVVA